jgi:hypothetical protein
MPHGLTSESFSIDRRNPEKGYVPGNIRVMPYGLNSGKVFNNQLAPCVMGINAGWINNPDTWARINSFPFFGDEVPF